jgi:hypothetical protein
LEGATGDQRFGTGQPLAGLADDHQRERGRRLGQCGSGLAGERQGGRIFQRRGLLGPGLAGKQVDLAKHIAGIEHLAAGAVALELYVAAHQDKELIRRLTRRVDDVALFEGGAKLIAQGEQFHQV